MREELATLGRYIGQTARLMVGVPSYDNYLKHHRETHPDQEPMDYETFFRQRQEARYGAKRVGCC